MPLYGADVPVPQDMQLETPINGLYWPAGQLVHPDEPAPLYWPALQLEQPDAPALLYVPAPHWFCVADVEPALHQ